jgi:hypothetical protein
MRTAFAPDRGSADVSARTAVWVKGCGLCRRSYDARAWEALPTVETLPPATVQAHLSVPARFAVVLRRCACGAVLAARAA